MDIIKETLIYALQAVIIVTVPLLVALAKKGVSKVVDILQEKSQNEVIDVTLGRLEKILNTVVSATAQTYVDNLKADGRFSLEEQKKAFEISKTEFEKVIGEEGREFIVANVGDYETWVKNAIESMVKTSK